MAYSHNADGNAISTFIDKSLRGRVLVGDDYPCYRKGESKILPNYCTAFEAVCAQASLSR